MSQCLAIPLLVIFLILIESNAGCCEEKANDFIELIKIAKLFQIEIITYNHAFPIKTTHGPINGKNADKKSLEPYVLIFAQEFSLYNPDIIKKMQLKRVVFCVDLSFDGQLRGAVPDFEHNTLYLDIACGAYLKLYQREVIHHELFHIIDWRDDGNLYKDEVWSALNPKSFAYGTGGKNAQNPDSGVLTDKYPGFLNHYSTTGVEEDKAEVFAKMMLEQAYLKERIKKDKVLSEKVERMKALTISFCSAMPSATAVF